jgi:hypothetical protein
MVFKKVSAWFLVLTVFFMFAGPAFAQENTVAEEPTRVSISIESLLERAKVTDNNLSRGAFAVMLTHAAKIPAVEIKEGVNLPMDLNAENWYAGAIMALHDRNIMRGFANKVYPDAPITGIEAVALVARTMGIPEDVVAEGIQVNGIKKEHWGYELYSWMVKENLTSENIDIASNLEPETAAKLVVKVFGTDDQARSIMDEANEKNKDIKSFRARGDMALKLDMIGEDIPDLPMEFDVTYDMEFNREVLHQKMNTGLLGMEQYMDKEYIYSSTTTEEGETQWMKMKNFMPILFDENFLSQQQDWAKDIEDLTFYRFLGKESIDGKECYKIAMYARLDDFDQLLKQITAFGIQEGQSLEAINNFINSMSMRGITYIDMESGLPNKVNMSMIISLNEEIQQDSPTIIKTIQMDMNYDYYDYNADIMIEIPEEAKNAQELDFERLPTEDLK